MTDKLKVYDAFFTAQDLIESRYDQNCFGLFLKGSQNYGLDVPESDIDLVALLIPTNIDLFRNRKLPTKTIEYKYGLVSLMDIRDFINQLINGSPQALELMCTEYYLITEDKNKRALSLWQNFTYYNTNFLSRINPQETLSALTGQLKSYRSKLEKQVGTDDKNLMHCARLSYLIVEYCKYDTRKYASYLKPNMFYSSFRNAKMNEETLALADKYVDVALDAVKDCKNLHASVEFYRDWIEDFNFLDSFIEEVLSLRY